MEIYGKDEHVEIIEKVIRVVKEGCRYIKHSIPYRYYTKLMVQSLIARVVKCINAFPIKNGISSTMIPYMIVESKCKPDFNHKQITFGSYDMVYTGTTNDMKIRIIPSISLNESNERGGSYFMSLYIVKLLPSYQWTYLPIDDNVIAQVRYLAEEDNA